MIDKKPTYQELENQIEKLSNELLIVSKEAVFQNKEKTNRADELVMANKELVFQNDEKAKRAAELIIAKKELIFQDEEKARRAAELIIADILKEDNAKWTNELIIAKEIVEESERNLKTINEEYETTNEELRQANDELIIAKEKVEERERDLKAINEEYEAINEELRQTNEELIKAKEKAQESERLKSAFLSNMSHEIRTPLNIITGYSELLAENNLTKVERTEYISVINTNSIRLFNLIDNILDLSKIEAGQKIVKFKLFDINKLIDELFEQNKKIVEKKQLQLNIHKGIENEQTFINNSEQLIYQIFTNLINNAIKYSLSGKIDYGYILKKNDIELFVSDTGIGISKEYSSNLFKRFSQENSALSRTYEGAGLGLSIVKGIVELLNGTIDVNSEKGKGTIFKINLPINELLENENAEGNKVIQREKQPYKKITLLIVEDDETSFFLLNKKILQEFPCEIIHAINGYEAIERVKEHPELNCILMDLHLPGMDGCETTECIKKLNKNLPVFAVTAAVMDTDKEQAMKAGCDEFLSKPVDREKLYQLIFKYKK